jgi:hypothetical protein
MAATTTGICTRDEECICPSVGVASQAASISAKGERRGSTGSSVYCKTPPRGTSQVVIRCQWVHRVHSKVQCAQRARWRRGLRAKRREGQECISRYAWSFHGTTTCIFHCLCVARFGMEAAPWRGTDRGAGKQRAYHE